jgi:pimeloyl-ACP methyl ester carboxylesterase
MNNDRPMKAEEFIIDIPEEQLTDLKDRLENTRWPDEIEDSGWDFGTNLSYMQQLVEYWKKEYDWRSNETRLNSWQQFKTTINEQDIHYIHVRGKGPDPLPIILTHGWPDSFLRFEKIIPLLADPGASGGNRADAFDVIVPSIPGFGFSGGPSAQTSIFQVHNLWAKLMTDVLGYERFVAHGGDWGSLVTEHLARSHSRAVAAIHLTDVSFLHSFQKPDKVSPAEQKYFEAMEKKQMTENAYAMLQGTRPQTLSAGLTDSPAALAAWVVEKFQSWSDHNNLENTFTKDELLTNISLYWFTGSVTSSFLPYYDVVNAGALTWMGEKVKEWTGSSGVPAAFAIFGKENTNPPREWAERFFNVQRWTQLPKGGHFGALEQPEMLAEDLREFFRPFRAK